MPALRIISLFVTAAMILAAFLLFESEGHFYVTTELLPRGTVWSLYISFALIAIGLIAQWRHSLSPFIKTSKSTRLTLLTLSIGAVIFLKTNVPETNRVYFDEHIYENIGQLISTTGEALMVNEGAIRQGKLFAKAREYNKQPNGYPVYLSFFYQFLDVNEPTAFWAVNVAYFLSILTLFGISYLLFHSELGALFTALCFAMTPMVLRFANSAAVELPTVLFSTLAIYTAILYRNAPSLWTGASMVGGLAYAFQMRGESPLILLPALVILLPIFKSELKQNRFYVLLPALTALLIPLFLHILSFRNHSWGSGTGDKFSLDAFKMNIGMNVPFYFTNIRFPLAFTVFAIAGFFINDKKNKTELAAITLWFIYSFGIFLFFYAGGYNYGIDVRYSNISAPPLALLTGYGAHSLIRWLRSNTSLPPFVPAVLLLAALFGSWAFTLPEITLLGQEARQARFDTEFARVMRQNMPADSFVFSHNPGMWLVFGQSAAQSSNLSYLLDQPLQARNQIREWRNSYPGGLFFHWNFWCNTMDRVQVAFCQRILDGFKHKKVFEQTDLGRSYAIFELLDY